MSARAVLERAYNAARVVHADLALSRDAFVDGMQLRVRWRLDRAGLEDDEHQIVSVLERTAHADLYLALACEHEVDGAWGRLIELHAPRLDGLARSLGVRGSDSVGRDLLADLAVPPKDRRTRTLVGTYDGSGPLFAWLAVILRRRLADETRTHRPVPKSAWPGELRGQAIDADDPFEQLVDAEAASKLMQSIQEGWRQLDRRERLALLYKYGEGLRQREIAVLLGLSESRTSRLLKGALDRLRRHVSRRLSDTDWKATPSHVRLWTALERAVSLHLRAEGGFPPAGPVGGEVDRG